MSDRPLPPPAALAAVLADLYADELRRNPAEIYLEHHARPDTVATQVAVFRWYAPHLAALPGWAADPGPVVLDWGCRHAPDACLLRAAFGPNLQLCGADVYPTLHYPLFHRYAGLHYYPIDHVYKLPYLDATVDAVVGSGTLEHVAMDYESLKELWRVLKPGGRLVIAYLPNRWSYEEWWQRRAAGGIPHPRLYSLGELRHMLLHHGFRIVTDGFQTRHDALGGAPAWQRRLVRAGQLYRFTSTVCAIAEKVPAML